MNLNFESFFAFPQINHLYSIKNILKNNLNINRSTYEGIQILKSRFSENKNILTKINQINNKLIRNEVFTRQIIFFLNTFIIRLNYIKYLSEFIFFMTTIFAIVHTISISILSVLIARYLNQLLTRLVIEFLTSLLSLLLFGYLATIMAEDAAGIHDSNLVKESLIQTIISTVCGYIVMPFTGIFRDLLSNNQFIGKNIFLSNIFDMSLDVGTLGIQGITTELLMGKVEDSNNHIDMKSIFAPISIIPPFILNAIMRISNTIDVKSGNIYNYLSNIERIEEVHESDSFIEPDISSVDRMGSMIQKNINDDNSFNIDKNSLSGSLNLIIRRSSLESNDNIISEDINKGKNNNNSTDHISIQYDDRYKKNTDQVTNRIETISYKLDNDIGSDNSHKVNKNDNHSDINDNAEIESHRSVKPLNIIKNNFIKKDNDSSNDLINDFNLQREKPHIEKDLKIEVYENNLQQNNFNRNIDIKINQVDDLYNSENDYDQYLQYLNEEFKIVNRRITIGQEMKMNDIFQDDIDTINNGLTDIYNNLIINFDKGLTSKDRNMDLINNSNTKFKVTYEMIDEYGRIYDTFLENINVKLNNKNPTTDDYFNLNVYMHSVKNYLYSKNVEVKLKFDEHTEFIIKDRGINIGLERDIGILNDLNYDFRSIAQRWDQVISYSLESNAEKNKVDFTENNRTIQRQIDIEDIREFINIKNKYNDSINKAINNNYDLNTINRLLHEYNEALGDINKLNLQYSLNENLNINNNEDIDSIIDNYVVDEQSISSAEEGIIIKYEYANKLEEELLGNLEEMFNSLNYEIKLITEDEYNTLSQLHISQALMYSNNIHNYKAEAINNLCEFIDNKDYNSVNNLINKYYNDLTNILSAYNKKLNVKPKYKKHTEFIEMVTS